MILAPPPRKLWMPRPTWKPRRRPGVLNMAVGDQVLGTGGAKAVRAGTGEWILSDGTDACTTQLPWRRCSDNVVTTIVGGPGYVSGTQYVNGKTSGGSFQCLWRDGTETPVSGTPLATWFSIANCSAYSCVTHACGECTGTTPKAVIASFEDIALPAVGTCFDCAPSSTSRKVVTADAGAVNSTFTAVQVDTCLWYYETCCTTIPYDHDVFFDLGCDPADADADNPFYECRPEAAEEICLGVIISLGAGGWSVSMQEFWKSGGTPTGDFTVNFFTAPAIAMGANCLTPVTGSNTISAFTPCDADTLTEGDVGVGGTVTLTPLG